jgi:hypothetical protein
MPDEKLLITNVSLFRIMAEEAATKSLESLNAHRTPKPNGEPGFILRGDNRVSFKQALIAIAFSGIYLEALLAIATREARRTGRRHVSKAKEKPRYDGKLKALGVKDHGLLKAAHHFNDVRDDLIHEKPVELSTLPGAVNVLPHVKSFVAQNEAQKAISLINQVTLALRPVHGEGKTGAS